MDFHRNSEPFFLHFLSFFWKSNQRFLFITCKKLILKKLERSLDGHEVAKHTYFIKREPRPRKNFAIRSDGFRFLCIFEA